LREIASTTVPEDAFGPALRAIIDALGAHAAALCLFDPEHRVLRLAAEIGLSDEACRQLRTVREGLPMGWDMPLHSLLNRRAYLIDSASRNRYVPPLIEPAASVGTAACIPVVVGSLPLASLLLVTLAPRRLDEKDLLALQPALRDLAVLIVALRRRPPGATSWTPPASFRIPTPTR
jgi:GAF domain-containing protein